jgi:hypothetical protein
MIFNVDSSQIEKLDSKQLVEMLKKLLHAEAQKFGIGLRGVSVTLQITVPDGGEDGRIEWKEHLEQTDYIPSRFCIFQSKATKAAKMGKAEWKKEIWTKASQKKNAPQRELNDAMNKVIAENGSYIGFTSANLGGSNNLGESKKDDRIQGIKDGILDAGGDLDSLKNIDIYDAEKIADWVNKHPAVAVWLNERQSELSLRGFQTVERWGKRPDIVSNPQVQDEAKRFLIGNKNVSPKDNSIPFDKAKERIADYLFEPKKTIRVIGSSGVGKTRFVYEVLRDNTSITKIALATSAIYCDFRDVGSQIFGIIQSFSETRKSALVIVDECSRDAAIRIGEIVATEGSNLRIITIGNDNQSIDQDNCLNISVLPADDNLIEGIIKQRHPKADCVDINFIIKISCGYPLFAVLVTDSHLSGTPILKAVEGAVERMLIGCGINRVEQVRAIECLALFKELGADEDSSSEIDFVAKNLARQTGDEMYEHLAYAAKQGIVAHQDNYFIIPFPPVAAFLGERRIDLLRVNTVLNFIENSSPKLRRSFLSQWDNFTSSRTASIVAQRLLSVDGLCGSLNGLKTEIGSQCLKATVYINPDRVTKVIESMYVKISLDDLKIVVTRRQDLLEVLEKLVSRKESFQVAALLLLRLAAIGGDPGYRNAKNIFTKLFYFQLSLSLTKAERSERFKVIDDGIESNDERIISICIDALENTLKERFSGHNSYNPRINQTPFKDWESKKDRKEIVDFKRHGIRRIKDIRVNHRIFLSRCEKILSLCIWSLRDNNLLSDIETIIKDISKEKGVWFKAIEEINDWLYSCRTEKSEEYYIKVKKLYDDIIPEDLIGQALLYTSTQLKDIHTQNINKNCTYPEDFEYSARKAKEVATEIGKCKKTTRSTIQTIVKEELDSINTREFVRELVLHLENPIEAFSIAVTAFKQSTELKGIKFIQELIIGIDRRNIEDRLSIEDICSLLDSLVVNHGSDGSWEAFQIIYQIYCHNKEENLDERIIERLKDLINSPKLLENIERCKRNRYLFDELTPLVQDDSF